MTQTGERVDPLASFNFRIQIQSVIVAGFAECTGYSSTVGLIEYRQGGDLHPMKLPGLNRYGNIILRRGMTTGRELYEWHLDALRGELRRTNGSILLQDRVGAIQAQFDFFEAWPQRMTGPSLNATDDSIAIEEFELAVERLERVK
jgi:phage tail-like protein